MRTVIIGDKTDKSNLGESIKDGVKNLFETSGAEYSFYEVGKEDLNFCVGCFGCWTKTPGVCVFNDLGREINREFVNSDVVVLLSPVRYGCYSTAIKRVWDRSIPIILPFFKKINNEVHHAPRYSKYPELVIVGYGENISDSEVETFKSLSAANAVNFQTKEARAYVCRGERDVDRVMQSVNSYVNEKEGEKDEKSMLRKR